MADPDSFFRYVRINSKNRVRGSGGDFVVDISQDSAVHKVSEVHIMSASLIHDFTNVNSNNNILYVVGSAGGATTLTIPVGQYTTSTLLTELTTQINAAYTPNTIALTQSSLTNKISFTMTGETFQFVGKDTQPLSTLAPLLGITTTAATSASGTFDETPALNGIEHIYVQSASINPSGNIKSQFGTFDKTFLSIPVNVAYGSLITYQSQSAHQEQINYNAPRDLSNVDIRLTDDDGNVLELGDNHEFVLIMKFFFVN